MSAVPTCSILFNFSGSGSKWIFEMVQYASGVKNFDLWMEHEVTYKKNVALLTKSHHQRAERYTKVLSGKKSIHPPRNVR